jgi:arylsulfatase A-like enzyme
MSAQTSPVSKLTSGLIAGVQTAAAYAALELLLTGPLTSFLKPAELIGPWYTQAVFTYAALYTILGAVAGVAIALARLQPAPTLAALLLLCFAANTLIWDHQIQHSPFLVLILPLALWLLAGAITRRPDPSRVLLSSPWAAAILTLTPVWLSRELMRSATLPARLAVSGGIVAALLGLALLARSRPALRALTAPKLHAALTAATLLLSFAALQLQTATPIAAQSASTAPSRPNIILISLDTTRADHLSVYGYARSTTPNLEAFAKSATLYRHAYANGDMTLPTHASMLTGLFANQHGAHPDRSVFTSIAANVPTLPELLRAAGYRNYAVVANHGFLDPVFGFARGFDTYLIPRPNPVVGHRQTYLLRMGLYKLTLPLLWTQAMRRYFTADEIAASGEALAARAGPHPFFLFLNFMDPHRPWVSSGRFRDMFPAYDQSFDQMTIRGFEEEVIAGRRTVTPEERTKMHAAYDGGIAYLDDALGRLFARLRQQPWYDASLIFITADHGELFGEKGLIEHGHSVDQGLTSIPLLIKFPGQSQPQTIDSPVSQIDIFNTALAAAKIPLPGPRPGSDLAATDPGATSATGRIIIAESYPNDAFIMLNKKLDRMERALMQGPWKLIRSNRGRRELYNMSTDPAETKNLYAIHPEIAGQLNTLLTNYLASKTATESKAPADPEILQRLKSLGYAQ